MKISDNDPNCYEVVVVEKTFAGCCEAVFRELQESGVTPPVALAEISRKVCERLGFRG